jgi:preprotein translocase subunit SecE
MGDMTQITERPARAAATGGPPRRGLFGRIGLFYRQVIAELRKVLWPTRSELVTYTAVSIIFVSSMVAIVALLDFLFTKLVITVFG